MYVATYLTSLMGKLERSLLSHLGSMHAHPVTNMLGREAMIDTVEIYLKGQPVSSVYFSLPEVSSIKTNLEVVDFLFY